MEKKRSIGVTVFGILLNLIAVYIFVNFVRELVKVSMDYGWLESLIELAISGVYAIILIVGLILVAKGILKLRNWARVTCICLAFISGFGIIFFGLTFGIALSSEPNHVVFFQITLLVVPICVPTIFFSHPSQSKGAI